MDRLVCGDVGFGKTEVAIRAAFRVAMAGKQVAVLCPTTVLAQQHFRTFEARMRDYPITIARALALPDARRSRTRRCARAQGRQGRHRHRHASPALEGRPLQATSACSSSTKSSASASRTRSASSSSARRSTCSRSPRRRSRARCRWRSAGCATCRSSRRRPSIAAPSAPSSRAATSRSSREAIARELGARRAGLLRLQPHRGHLRARRSACSSSCPRRASPSPTGR